MSQKQEIPKIRLMRKSDEKVVLDVFKSKRNYIMMQMLRKTIIRKRSSLIWLLMFGLLLTILPIKKSNLWLYLVYAAFVTFLLISYYVIEALSFHIIVERGMAKELFHGCYEYYQREGRALLVAELFGRVVGIAAIDRAGGVGDTCEWKRITILPPFKRRGVGKKLNDECLSLSKMLGYKKAVLHTTELQQPAISLYSNMGFAMINSYIYPWCSININVGIYEKLLE